MPCAQRGLSPPADSVRRCGGVGCRPLLGVAFAYLPCMAVGKTEDSIAVGRAFFRDPFRFALVAAIACALFSVCEALQPASSPWLFICISTVTFGLFAFLHAVARDPSHHRTARRLILRLFDIIEGLFGLAVFGCVVWLLYAVCEALQPQVQSVLPATWIPLARWIPKGWKNGFPWLFWPTLILLLVFRSVIAPLIHRGRGVLLSNFYRIRRRSSKTSRIR